MKNRSTLIGLVGASCLAAFVTVMPAEATAKPCCYNNGRYYEASSRTCYRYGGDVVPQRFCRVGYYGYPYGRDGGVSVALRLGDVVIAYSDGYYDRDRRWHRWRSDREREWFRHHHGRHYRHWRHDHDRR